MSATAKPAARQPAARKPAARKPAARKPAARKPAARKPFFKVRRSRVHGLGAFATRRIRKGARICEYLGERITHQEADRRYESKAEDDNHTFLFIVDRWLVIDAGVGGNDARFINHGCDPNCESVTEQRRVFIEATRTIQPGEELKYDYSIGRADDDPPNVDDIYACRCGATNCRGTMLWPAKRPKQRARPRAKPRAGLSEARRAGTSPRQASRSRTQSRSRRRARSRAA